MLFAVHTQAQQLVLVSVVVLAMIAHSAIARACVVCECE